MSSTDQQADAPAHGRRRGPGRARGARGPRPRRGVRRRHAGPVARARGRRAAQGRPRGPARPGRGRAEPHGRHRRPRRAALHRRGRRATCRRRSASRASRRSCAAPARVPHPESGVPGGWDVRQRHAHPDVAVTKEAIAADLENGVTSLWLVLGEGAIPVDALGDVLVRRPARPRAGDGAGRAAGRRGVPRAGRGPHRPGARRLARPRPARPAGRERGAAGPLRSRRRRPPGRRARRACAPSSSTRPSSPTPAPRPWRSSAARWPPGSPTCGRSPTAGCRSTRRSASWSSATPRAPTSSRPSPALRAARRLWDRVGEASGASPEARAQRQHAVTSSVMTTKRDPWVNMLRTTVACFAAGVGGADVVTVQPFDAALGLPDAFSRRIARNTQSLLVEEGHLARVLDPAGGSWYVESLTDSARAGGLGLVHRDRAGRRPGRGAGLRAWCATGSPPPGTPAPSGWPPARTRSPASASSRTWPRSCPSREPAAEVLPVRRAAPGAGRAGVRGAARRRGRRRRAADGLPRDDRPDRPAHRPGVVRRQPVPGRRPRRRRPGTASSGLAEAGDDGRLHLRHRQGLRRVRRRPGRAS